MRALFRLCGNRAAAKYLEWRRSPLLRPETFTNVGYVRDALLILGIVALGTYFMENPDKFDAVLNWTLGRHTNGPIV
jgi:hypothetical protein